MKSRAKRYEKLDFLGEGQVRLSGRIRRALKENAEPPHTLTDFLVESRGLTWRLLFGRSCPNAPANLCVYPRGEPLSGPVLEG